MEPLAQPRAQRVEVNQSQILVREWGNRGGRSLLYWHALNPFAALELAEVAPTWAAAGFHVVAPAAPGCGESPRLADEDYRPSRLAHLVPLLADALGAERFDFVGASWGAAIGLQLAALAPERVRSLVLLDGGYNEVSEDGIFASKSLAEIKAMFVSQQSHFAFRDRATFLEAMRDRFPRWSDSLEQRLLAGLQEQDGSFVPASDPEAAAAAIYGVKVEPSRDVLEKVAMTNIPVLLLASENVSAEPRNASALARFRSLLPTAAVELIADAGHDLLADAPQATAARVVSWLAET